jgi:plastocyanin
VRSRILKLSLVLLPAFLSCGVEPVGPGTPAPTHDVAIQEGAEDLGPNAFSPNDKVISLASQATVTWHNADLGFYGGGAGTDHRLVSDDDTTFDSGNLSPNGTFSATFTAPGTYTYHCDYHEDMTGTVTVNP